MDEGEGDCAGKCPVGSRGAGDFFGVWKISGITPLAAVGVVTPVLLRFRKMLGGDIMPMRLLLLGLNTLPKGDTGLLPDVRLNFGD